MTSTSARGLFKATGNTAKPIMTDIFNGEAVYADTVEREKDDFYPTPPEPIRALLSAEIQHIARYAKVWEAACGDGAMTREMEAVGLSVYQSDLIDRGAGGEIKSFYDFANPPSKALVTNPPFQECNSGDWIRMALDRLGIEYMALLLPVNWMGAMTRGALWAQHTPARVYLMRWRIDFTGQGAPPMLNAWYVWDGQTDENETRLLMMDRKDARQGVML